MNTPELISKLGSGEPVTFAEVSAVLRPFLPLLDALPDTAQEAEWHAEGNVAVHSALVLEHAQELADETELVGFDRAALLLAAALHDIGKTLTTREELDEQGQTRLRSRQHARRGRDYAAYRLLDAQLSPRFLLTVLNLIAEHHSLHRALEANLNETNLNRGVWALSRRVNLPLLVLLARADARGREVRSGDASHAEDTAALLELTARELNLWKNADPYAEFRAEIQSLLPGASPELLALAVGRGIHDWEAGVIHTPHEAVARVQDAARHGFPRLTVLCGPSGSGKSTHAHSLPGTEIISLDALRGQLGKNTSDQSVNGQVMQAAREQLREAMRRKRHAIWDATTLRRNQRTQIIDLAHNYGALTEIHTLWTPPNQLGTRNQTRERTVSSAVIAEQLKMLEFPEVTEAHTVRYFTHAGELT